MLNIPVSVIFCPSYGLRAWLPIVAKGAFAFVNVHISINLCPQLARPEILSPFCSVRKFCPLFGNQMSLLAEILSPFSHHTQYKRKNNIKNIKIYIIARTRFLIFVFCGCRLCLRLSQHHFRHKPRHMDFLSSPPASNSKRDFCPQLASPQAPKNKKCP